MCLCRLSSIYAWQEVSIAFRVWNDITLLSRNGCGSSNIIIIICLLTSHRLCLFPLIIFVIFSFGFDLDPRPYPPSPFAICLLVCMYVCVCVLALVSSSFDGSVLSNSNRVKKGGGSTCIHRRHCRFFFLNMMCNISKPSECFFSLIYICFILIL